MSLPAGPCFAGALCGLPWWLPRACGRLLILALAWSVHAASAAPATKANDTSAAPTGPALARPQADAVEPPTLRVPVTSNAQLVFQPRPWQTTDALTAASLQVPIQQTRLGLEFKATRPTDGARSWLRVQLSGDSVLQFRPRGGGLVVTYRSQF